MFEVSLPLIARKRFSYRLQWDDGAQSYHEETSGVNRLRQFQIPALLSLPVEFHPWAPLTGPTLAAVCLCRWIAVSLERTKLLICCAVLHSSGLNKRFSFLPLMNFISRDYT